MMQTMTVEEEPFVPSYRSSRILPQKSNGIYTKLILSTWFRGSPLNICRDVDLTVPKSRVRFAL